jgi:hypothetical protein
MARDKEKSQESANACPEAVESRSLRTDALGMLEGGQLIVKIALRYMRVAGTHVVDISCGRGLTSFVQQRRAAPKGVARGKAVQYHVMALVEICLGLLLPNLSRTRFLDEYDLCTVG